MKKIIFWGATGQAKVLREFIELRYTLIALFDNDPLINSPFLDVPLYHGLDGFKIWRDKHKDLEVACLVAIGGDKGRDRVRIQGYLEQQGIEPIVAVHPTAFVAGYVQLSKGCQVLANATVCVDVSMGESCIINTSAVVDHETVLGKGVYVGPGATLTGCIAVGDYSMIGAGSVVLPRVKIGNDVVIGAGSVVITDIPDGKVVVGNPSKILGDSVLTML